MVYNRYVRNLASCHSAKIYRAVVVCDQIYDHMTTLRLDVFVADVNGVNNIPLTRVPPSVLSLCLGMEPWAGGCHIMRRVYTVKMRLP